MKNLKMRHAKTWIITRFESIKSLSIFINVTPFDGNYWIADFVVTVQANLCDVTIATLTIKSKLGKPFARRLDPLFRTEDRMGMLHDGWINGWLQPQNSHFSKKRLHCWYNVFCCSKKGSDNSDFNGSKWEVIWARLGNGQDIQIVRRCDLDERRSRRCTDSALLVYWWPQSRGCCH
jgi:hypothetical protein